MPMTMDVATEHHLDQWLEREVLDDDRRRWCKLRMIEVYESDPLYWGNAGWWKVYDEAGCGYREEKR